MALALFLQYHSRLNGCYEALSGGLPSEALTDFTGGVVELFELRDQAPPNLFQIMLKANSRGSLMGCCVFVRIFLIFIYFNPRMPKVFRQPKTPKGGGYHPPGFLPSHPNFLKIFLMGMFSGSRNPTVIIKKFYLYCMTWKIKVKHLFA